MKIPERILLANLPTKIEKLERLSQELGGPCIYLKRDDQTGMEISGNKIRKLEFSIKEALSLGCNYLITCGGIQSNHCRATAAVAAKLGLKVCLVLLKNKEEEIDGNLFLDKLFGAEIRYFNPEENQAELAEILKQVSSDAEKKGFKPYIIPVGASNGIGAFGYFQAMKEIAWQEKEMGVQFDMIVSAVGSGGTYSGLFLGKKVLNHPADIYGVNICENTDYFVQIIDNILQESLEYLNIEFLYAKNEIHLIDGYVGRGYALSSQAELQFIHKLAKMEGVILDPVYTGKAMYGLTEEIKKGRLKAYQNILFIHTGGLFGLFPQKNMFDFS
ncbi:MAG: D-cysteine desulfhydrase family protein [Desulfitobacteriaceae bacterium]